VGPDAVQQCGRDIDDASERARRIGEPVAVIDQQGYAHDRVDRLAAMAHLAGFSEQFPVVGRDRDDRVLQQPLGAQDLEDSLDQGVGLQDPVVVLVRVVLARHAAARHITVARAAPHGGRRHPGVDRHRGDHFRQLLEASPQQFAGDDLVPRLRADDRDHAIGQQQEIEGRERQRRHQA
jgi:hypothetical protein